MHNERTAPALASFFFLFFLSGHWVESHADIQIYFIFHPEIYIRSTKKSPFHASNERDQTHTHSKNNNNNDKISISFTFFVWLSCLVVMFYFWLNCCASFSVAYNIFNFSGCNHKWNHVMIEFVHTAQSTHTQAHNLRINKLLSKWFDVQTGFNGFAIH